MYNKKVIALIMAVTMIGVVTFGCSDNKTEDKKKPKAEVSSTKIVEVTTDTEIFDGKKETRTFTISEPLFERDGSYIEEYAIEKENDKNILHLKGKFRIIDTMDGEVGTATEAKLEIADECVFNDCRSGEKSGMNLKEFKEHINSKDFHKSYSITITVDNGLVWMVELQN